jgi:hypothetical protein
MNFKKIAISSKTALDFDCTLNSSVCVIHGRNSDLVLDLLRELMCDFNAQNDADRIDDGRFVIHADVEMDGKDYSVCCIRNADFLGDTRFAVNFDPNRTRFSEDDTKEYIHKCNERNSDNSNVMFKNITPSDQSDDRPIFIYDVLDHLDEAIDVAPFIKDLSDRKNQVFIAVCPSYPIEKLKHGDVQILKI